MRFFDTYSRQQMIDIINRAKAVNEEHHIMLSEKLSEIPPKGMLFLQETIEVNKLAIAVLEDLIEEFEQSDENSNDDSDGDSNGETRKNETLALIAKVFDTVYKGVKILEALGLGGDSGLLSFGVGDHPDEPTSDCDS